MQKLLNNWLTVFIVLLIIWLSRNSTASLPKEFPLLWSETGIHLKSENSSSTSAVVKLQIPTPCDNINQQVQTWCEQQLDNLIKSLEDICRPSYAATAATSNGAARRVRRQASSSPQRSSNSNEYEELQRRMGDIEENIRNFNYVRQDLETSLSRLQTDQQSSRTDVSLIHSQLNELTQRQSDLEINLAAGVTSTSQAVTYFINFQRDLTKIETMWRQQLPFSAKLVTLFNLTLAGPSAQQLLNQFGSTVPNQCYIKTNDPYIYFEFNQSSIYMPNVRVLKSKAFTFYKLQASGSSSIGYKMEYVGPSHVIYDSGTGCLAPYNKKSEVQILWPSSNDTCNGPSDTNLNAVQKYWRKTCDPCMYYLDASSIQVHLVDDSHYYIYCAGFSIMAYKKLTACPNHVFSLHGNEFEHVTFHNGGQTEVGSKLDTVLSQSPSSGVVCGTWSLRQKSKMDSCGVIHVMASAPQFFKIDSCGVIHVMASALQFFKIDSCGVSFIYR